MLFPLPVIWSAVGPKDFSGSPTPILKPPSPRRGLSHRGREGGLQGERWVMPEQRAERSHLTLSYEESNQSVKRRTPCFLIFCFVYLIKQNTEGKNKSTSTRGKGSRRLLIDMHGPRKFHATVSRKEERISLGSSMCNLRL